MMAAALLARGGTRSATQAAAKALGAIHLHNKFDVTAIHGAYYLPKRERLGDYLPPQTVFLVEWAPTHLPKYIIDTYLEMNYKLKQPIV
jgi:hypothetical protein